MNRLRKLYWRLRYWGRGPIHYESSPPRPVKDIITEIAWDDVPLLKELGYSKDKEFRFDITKKIGG